MANSHPPCAAGLQATKASPLSALPKADSLDGAALRHKGLLSKTGQLLPAWQTALGVVADPAARLDLTLCEALDRLETSYYAADGVVASHVQLEGNHRWRRPSAEISEAIGGWLLLDGVPEPKTPLSCKLSAAELLALSALADAYREDQLRAFLVRRASRVLAFSLQTLWRQAQSGLDQRDRAGSAACLRSPRRRRSRPIPSCSKAGWTALFGAAGYASLPTNGRSCPKRNGIALRFAARRPASESLGERLERRLERQL